MILQALDFKYLHEHKNVDLQCAGSDQWGNITAGIDLIRKSTGDEVYGFTMPLVTDSQGKKFGKSEGNALWLDKEKTSSYKLYQFFTNVEDSMVIDYLKIYTFLSKEEIEEYERKNIEDLFGNEQIKEVEANQTIADLAVNIGAASSKREAREFIANGAISVNGEKITDASTIIDENMFIEGTYIIVKRGKKNSYIGKKK